MQSTPVLNVGGITGTYTAGSAAVVVGPNLTLTGRTWMARDQHLDRLHSAQDRLGISGQGATPRGRLAR